MREALLVLLGATVIAGWLLLAAQTISHLWPEPPAPVYAYPRGNCKEMSYLLSNRRLATPRWTSTVIPVCGE